MVALLAKQIIILLNTTHRQKRLVYKLVPIGTLTLFHQLTQLTKHGLA